MGVRSPVIHGFKAEWGVYKTWARPWLEAMARDHGPPCGLPYGLPYGPPQILYISPIMKKKISTYAHRDQAL